MSRGGLFVSALLLLVAAPALALEPSPTATHVIVDDTVDAGWRFGLGIDYHVLPAEQGPRAAFDARMHVGTPGQAGQFFGAVDAFCFVEGDDSAGTCYGFNTYVGAYAGDKPSLLGAEINTDAQVPVWLKVGLQIVDIGPERGLGRDAGIWVGTQPGARGFAHAIEVAPDAIAPDGVAIRLPADLSSGVVWGAAGEERVGLLTDGTALYVRGAGSWVYFQHGTVNVAGINLATGQFCRLAPTRTCWP